MDTLERLKNAGLFDRSVPRYTSYPTAPQFHEGIAAPQFGEWLAGLDTDRPVSLYVHIPFCERLCWFCACRTQGVKTLAPVEAYLETLLAEIAMFKAARPKGVKLARLHFGGGSPTIMSLEMINKLNDAIRNAIDFEDGYEFSVEIDPTACNIDKIKAFAKGGMNRASIGVQDFNEKVQAAIGRPQGYDLTRRIVGDLRDQGIGSINIDMVYGLPFQDMDALQNTTRQVLTLAPDRVALFGYAHVPWMAKRQKMIPEDSLPGPIERFEQSEEAAAMFVDAGMEAIGIDHFAKPQDSLAIAARSNGLHRNFQGYTDDKCSALIGLGASSISRFPQGFIQNNVATTNYNTSISNKTWPAARGFELSLEDKMRSRAIEMLMCDFRIDLAALESEFGEAALEIRDECYRAIAEFRGFVGLEGDNFEILPEGQPLTRLIANVFDTFTTAQAKHSRAI